MEVLVICGATATGKTSLAVKFAKKLKSIVVSADSQLVYKGLNIGTAKPTEEEMDGVPHYMIDVAEPDSEYNVSDYCSMALPIVRNAVKCGKVPVICGGTGFYINSLLFEMSYGGVAADNKVRKELEMMAEEKGKESVYEILKQADPITAQKLHPNDLKRVIRAIEIYRSGGKLKSQLNDSFKPRFEYLAVSIDYPREELYQRIDERVDEMFENGLVEEVKILLNSGINENCRSMQAIGYKEVVECLKNGSSQSTMRDIIKKNTRNYAKRQITFFKKLPNLIKISPEEATCDKILELLNGKALNG